MTRFIKLSFVLITILGSSISQAASFDATVYWAKKTSMSVPVSGKISTIDVSTGQEIKKGQKLLQFDQVPFKAAVDQATALSTRQRTLYKAAKREYEQAKELYARTVLSTVALEEAKEKFQRASAEYKAARASESIAQYQFSQSTLTAPFDGWVLAVYVSAGQTIANDLETKPLVIIAEKGQYLARGELPLEKIMTLKIGTVVNVEVGKKEVPGKVSSIGLEPIKKKDDLYYVVEVAFTLDSPLLRAGQSVEVESN